MQQSDEIIVLTNAVCNELIKLSHKKALPITIIPCCADFSLFDGKKIRQERKAEIKRKILLSEHSFILGYLGSLGPDYLIEEMVQVFKALLNLKKDSIFLFISNNGKDVIVQVFCCVFPYFYKEVDLSWRNH